ncbi:MAG TPA: YceH family protein [Blastocatellia bacterium]|nr:YceH family protein [Blastocatellia bacterium]
MENKPLTLVLTATEVRVLGSLIEKTITTPEYYPLSLNALTNACNQKSNRDPVVSYDEQTVLDAMDGLREKKLGWVIKKADSRVLKYGHIFPEAFHLTPGEVAAICAIMLRGPLTPGEIRACSGRMYNFSSLTEVEEALQQLIDNEQGSLAIKLPRQPGRKEARYAHLLSGEVIIEQLEADPAVAETILVASRAKLEEEILELRRELDDLRKDLNEFKKQFE